MRRRRDDAGAGGVSCGGGESLSARVERERERDEDRLPTALVPGLISEMFGADSFINANLTA